MKSGKVVYVVHCVDTEGPLNETIEATFGRIEKNFGIKLEPTVENLQRLQGGRLELGDATEAIRRMVNPDHLNNHANWSEIEQMLDEIMNMGFRTSLPDSNGDGWIYNWFCVDHVGYTENPRQRDLGNHRVFDYYTSRISSPDSVNDRIFFHYHPLPYNGKAHSCATFYFNNNHLYEILARKILDRQWFPAVFRAGFHTIRPDSNWFLEQWIPFDYSNQATNQKTDQPDLSGGRFGDWRRAPQRWGAYHPMPGDYQREGSCRRWIFRCLNMRARLRELTACDVEQAFAEADRNGCSILSFTNHDFRDMKSEVISTWKLIKAAAEKYPHVEFRHVNALEAARHFTGLRPRRPGLSLDMCTTDPTSMQLSIKTRERNFGPQPFLAVKTRDGRYYYDNLDFDIEANSWSYTLDWQTFPPETVAGVGIAATHESGTIEIINLDPNSGQQHLTLFDD